MDDPSSTTANMAGFILGAHPGLVDPNFHRAVVLLSAHTPGDGALGVIINRPTGKTLGNLREDVASPLMKNLPVFEGGPVSTSEILLAAWKWNLAKRNFRFFFGLEPENLEELVRKDPSIEARAFLGYSGWSAGQLEMEVARSDWAVSPFIQPFGKLSPESLWQNLLISVRPDWGILAHSPDNPSLN